MMSAVLLAVVAFMPHKNITWYTRLDINPYQSTVVQRTFVTGRPARSIRSKSPSATALSVSRTALNRKGCISDSPAFITGTLTPQMRATESGAR